MPTENDNNKRATAFSLYLHIPYCQSKCPYCDFNSHAVASWPEDDYVRALIAEIERRAGEAPWAGRRLKTIFFGGGTPSLFRAGIDRQRSSTRPSATSASRAAPRSRSRRIRARSIAAKLGGMRAAGVNRISFGAQSFNDERR